MSGIYINIPFPTFEQGCRTITIYADGVVTNYAEEVIGKAIPVPDHGRLIDADALMKHEVFIPLGGGHLPVVYAAYVRNAPSIIEADKEDE